MKLELKHLAPYLPYKVKLIYGCIYDVANDTTDVIGTGNIHHLINGHGTFIVQMALRPLSDLTNEIEHDVVNNYATGFGLDKDKIQADIDSGIIQASVYSLPYNKWNALVAEHFDVFGLIPQGLAIDINTIT